MRQTDLKLSPQDRVMVEAVRSKKPLPRLDAILHLKDPNPNEQWFELEYSWYPNRSYAQGLRALIAQAILFTCIQKAAVSSRARRDCDRR